MNERELAIFWRIVKLLGEQPTVFTHFTDGSRETQLDHKIAMAVSSLADDIFKCPFCKQGNQDVKK